MHNCQKVRSQLDWLAGFLTQAAEATGGLQGLTEVDLSTVFDLLVGFSVFSLVLCDK